MISYWLMFLVIAAPALVAPRISKSNRSLATWIVMGVVLVLFIGFRHEVGGDWFNYLRRFGLFGVEGVSPIMFETDPGYGYLNLLMNQWGFGIHAVNLVCALFFTVGLMVFARRQPYPWIALAVGFPYVILVVAMGYTRQGVAIGFILMALTALETRKFIWYLGLIACATIFHRTALVMIPLGLFLFGRGWVFRAATLLGVAFVLFDALLAEKAADLWSDYVDQQMISQGAQIRVLMNLVPSLLLLGLRKKWRAMFDDYTFWFWIAVASIACVFLVGFASTAVDRIALYCLPIQLVVFSRLPLLWRERVNPSVVRLGIVAGYALVLFVWLNYAAHARYWLPYQNFLFLS